nr:MAG TPA: hypothetical protein [Caudoviricetes sp.]
MKKGLKIGVKLRTNFQKSAFYCNLFYKKIGAKKLLFYNKKLRRFFYYTIIYK